MRHLARKIALEALYRFATTREDPIQALQDIKKREELPVQTLDYAREIVTGVRKRLTGIDALISKNLKNWNMERLSRIDQAILRIGVWELLNQDVPPPVVIDEAIRLAQEFGGEDSGGFINGILDAILKSGV